MAELPEDQAVLDSADEDDEFGEKRDDKEKVWRRRERPLLKVKTFEIYLAWEKLTIIHDTIFRALEILEKGNKQKPF